MDGPPSFTPTQFYGKSRKQKRQQEAIARRLGQNVIKLPSALSHRILGPMNCWKIFYRQTEAFSWARQTAEDVMVFAFENTDRDPAYATGQRRYLVTSLHVFWHYYSQMEPSKRHHYEIIPEGWPCRLYFDLEFLKHLNPGSDGKRMVEVLIQYVCTWLEAVFKLCCDRSCVLDLDASTESKFSRHLIFHIPGAVFVNCVAAGNFVRHIFVLLVKYIKLKSNELNISPTMLYEHCNKQHLCQRHQGFSNCTESQPHIVKNCDFDDMSDADLMVAAQLCEDVISQRCNVPTARTNDSGTNQDINCLAIQYRTNGISSDAVTSRSNDNSRPVPIEMRINHESSSVGLKDVINDISSPAMQFGITYNINVEEKQNQNHVFTSEKIEHKYGGTNTSSLSGCASSSGNSVVPCTSCLMKSDCASSSGERVVPCTGCLMKSDCASSFGERVVPCTGCLMKSDCASSSGERVVPCTSCLMKSDCASSSGERVVPCTSCLMKSDCASSSGERVVPCTSCLMKSDCASNSGERVVPCTGCLMKSDCTEDDMQSSANEMMRICGQLSLNDLESLLVSNSDSNKTTFADLGVYTKNRNFRLYLSSKLNKNNPLMVAASNQFIPERSGKISNEQAVFLASLVSNVRYASSVQILTFGNQSQEKCLTMENPKSVNCEPTHREDSLEGNNCPSPYPEIDGFIESLTWSHGCRGRVRRWMHFRASDSLMYDITGCRWCWNVHREHRSNNIMYIVDLRRGIYYQKCYDPDCQAVGYRSKAMEIPSNLLPSSFFEAAWDDDDEWEDDVCFDGDTKDNNDSNRLSECPKVDKWRQDDGLSGKDELKWKDRVSSFEDDDDDLLLAATEEVELGGSQLTQLPGLAAVPGRQDEDFDYDDDDAVVAATEEVEMYLHQDVYSKT